MSEQVKMSRIGNLAGPLSREREKNSREIKIWPVPRPAKRWWNQKSCAEILAAHKPSRVVAVAIARDQTGTLTQRELDEEKHAA
jgi:hypothetical protein